MSENKDQGAGARQQTQAMALHSQTTAVGLPQSIFPTSFEGAIKLSEALANSNLLRSELQGNVSSVFMTILTGLDLGISPAAALRSIHIVEGRPFLSAQLKVAICVARRDLCKYIRLVESTTERAVWETWRADRQKPETHQFTIEEARKSGLTDRGSDPKKNNWNRYPAAMLRARASSQLCDIVYPEIIVGVRTTEEAEDEGVIELRETAPGAFASVAPPPAPAQRAAEVSPRDVPASTPPAGSSGDQAAAGLPLPHERYHAMIAEADTQKTLNAAAARIKDAADRKEITEAEAAGLRTAFSERWQALAAAARGGGS